MNLTSKQWFQIISGMISGLITGAALFTTLFGQDLSMKIVAGLGVINIMLSSVGVALSGQAALVRDVQAMPGVETINVNGQASQALAQVAVDPANLKVKATPESADEVAATAKG